MEKLTKGILTAIAAILGGALLLWAAAAVLIALSAPYLSPHAERVPRLSHPAA